MKLKTLNDLLETTPALLDFVAVPSPLSSDYLKALIIEKLGEVEPVHQNPYVFMYDGALWFNTHGWFFTHVINVMLAEYSPIENYNRTEEKTETNSGEDERVLDGRDTFDRTLNDSVNVTDGTNEDMTGTVTVDNTGTDTNAKTGTETTTHTGTEATAHTGTVTEAHTGTDSRTISKDETQKIAGLDSSTFNNANQLIADNGDDLTHGESITTTHNDTDTLTHNKTDQLTHNTTDTLTHNTSELTTYDTDHNIEKQIRTSKAVSITDYTSKDLTDTFTHGHIVETESNIHGNIGVTTNQQMIEQELALVKAFNAYDVIVSVFENDLFITCYSDAFEGVDYEYSGV